MVAEAVGRMPRPVSVAATLINREGNLVATLTDGTTQNLGAVVGKDVDPAEVQRMITEAVAAIPKPRDGFGYDDMTEELADDGRTIIRRYARGADVKEFRHSMAVVLDRGVWREGEYQKGDGVTWAGSFWIAQETTNQKPEGGKGWRLAVKRGRDGKDAVVRSDEPHKPVRLK
jgi:hypothetical protein